MDSVINLLDHNYRSFVNREESCSYGQHAQGAIRKQRRFPRDRPSAEGLMELDHDLVTRGFKIVNIGYILFRKRANDLEDLRFPIQFLCQVAKSGRESRTI